MTEFPPICELIPHRGPMLLLDRVIDSSEQSIRCALRVRDDGLFNQGDQVPACLGIEYMAQTVAAYNGLRYWQQQQDIRLGFLLGSRHFATNVRHFHCAQVLEVTAENVIQSSNGMAAFKCSLVGDNIVQSATLNVFEPDDKDLEIMQLEAQA